MKLPIQAFPVHRTTSTTRIASDIKASMFGGICEALCDRLPEPARSICKAAC